MCSFSSHLASHQCKGHCLRSFYSSLEGAMKLKFAAFCSFWDALSDGILFFAKVKIFRFWPKTMDYNKAFWPKSRSFFVVLLLQNGRCYEAEICAILLLLRCPFRWYPLFFLPKSKFLRFWPKTMDYNKAFWPKSRSFFVVLLLQNGRCYEAEICAILLLLRCPFRWYPFLFCQSQNF